MHRLGARPQVGARPLCQSVVPVLGSWCPSVVPVLKLVPVLGARPWCFSQGLAPRTKVLHQGFVLPSLSTSSRLFLSSKAHSSNPKNLLASCHACARLLTGGEIIGSSPPLFSFRFLQSPDFCNYPGLPKNLLPPFSLPFPSLPRGLRVSPFDTLSLS